MPPLPLSASGALVGRSRELDVLRSAVGLDDEVRGAGALLLAGDAGVGKSRVLAELSDQARLAGWRVLRGACLDLGDSALPYLPFTEMFGRLTVDEPAVGEQLTADSPGLTRLLPDRRVLGGLSEPSGDRVERAELFDAVEHALGRLAQDRPLLVVVEDVHWADSSTREVLSYLFARGVPGATIIASYRSDDLHRRHPLRPVVAEWARLPRVTRLTLEPLADADVRSLVQDLADGPVAEDDLRSIVARAEGNAFFVEELVAARAARGRAISDDLAVLLLVRIDALDDPARRVVRAASVAGRRVSHELLAHVVGLDGDALDEAARGAVDGNVLVSSGPGAYAFRHALLAEAAYEDLLAGERIRLHGAFARVIGSRAVEGTAAELAHHARLAGDIDTAIVASVQAGDEALAVGGPDEAAHQYLQALELIDGRPGGADDVDVDVVDLTLRAADAMAAAGRVHRTLGLLQSRLASLPASAPDHDRAALLVALASTAFLFDNSLDPLELTTQAAQLVPPDPPTAVRARLASVRARTFAMFDRPDEAMRWAVEARELGERLGLAGVVAEAAVALADLDQRAGDPRASMLALEQSADAARAAGEYMAELRSLFKVGGLLWGMGDLDEARAVYTRVMDRAYELGRPWAPYGLDARGMRALVSYVLGDWDEVRRLADVRGEACPAVAQAALACVGLTVAAGRGDLTALPVLGALREWWEREGLIGIVCSGAAIDLHGDAGDLAAAVEVHRDVVETLTRVWQSPYFQAQIRLNALLLGQLATEAGRVGRAERAALVDRADGLVSVAEEVAAHAAGRGAGHRGPESEAWLARLHAEDLRLRWISGSAEDPGTVINAWTDAVDGFARFGHVFETARSQARLAAVLVAAGRTNEAAEQAAAARSVAARLGAQPLLRELQEVVPSSGRARPTPAQRLDAALTPREREVLVLLAAGRSNKEIGQHLFISTKTASVHVSNILGKLGASGRTEAVALARRRGDLTG